MTDQLDEALKRARKLTPEQQESLARTIIELAEMAEAHGPDEFIAEEHREGLERSIAQARRGEFVPDSEMKDFYKRFAR